MSSGELSGVGHLGGTRQELDSTVWEQEMTMYSTGTGTRTGNWETGTRRLTCVLSDKELSSKTARAFIAAGPKQCTQKIFQETELRNGKS